MSFNLQQIPIEWEINDGVNYIFDELRSTSSAITKSYTRAGGGSDSWVNAVVLLRPASI